MIGRVSLCVIGWVIGLGVGGVSYIGPGAVCAWVRRGKGVGRRVGVWFGEKRERGGGSV